MLDLPIEQRYRKENRMFHSSGWAIAAAVVGTAAAAGSAAVSINASQQAAKALAGSNADYAKALNAALSTYNAQQAQVAEAIKKLDPDAKVPNYSLLGTPDVYKTNKKGEVKTDKKGNPIIKEKARASAVLEGILAANAITANTIASVEQILPGAAKAREEANQRADEWEQRMLNQFAKTDEGIEVLRQSQAMIRAQEPQMQQARSIIDSYLTGDLPNVTKQQIVRSVAEAGGAGFNPQTARLTSGFQIGQANLSQQLMQSAEERQRFGLMASQNLTGQALGAAGQLTSIGGQFGAMAQTAANIGEAARGWEGTRQSWQSIAMQFNARPEMLMQIGLQGRGQDIDKIRIATEQQRILADMNMAALNASMGVAGAQSGARQSTISGNLAAQGAIASGIQGIGSAAAGGLSGIGTAYGQYSAAQSPNYERVYGPATSPGLAKSGWGNFDYGSGTGA
jgi:hypothetical protein